MPDYSFIAQPQGANMNQLGSLMNNMNAVQNFRMNQLNLQQKQATLPADIARAQAESQTAQTQSQVAAGTAAPTISQAETSAAGAKYKLQGEQAAAARQIAGGLLTDQDVQQGNSEGSVFALMRAEDQMKTAGIPEATIKAQMAPFYMMAAHNPQNLMPMLKQVAGANIGSAGQIQNAFPAPQQVNTGQVQVPVATGNPALTGVQAGTIQGAGVQNQLPPTTPTFNAQTNAPGYVGATGGAAPGPVQAGPSVVPQPLQGVATANAADWQATQQAASKAEQNAGIMDNLKMLAHGAVIGEEAGKRGYITGIRALFAPDSGTENMFQSIINAKSAGEAKTATDLFMKNANMPSLAGGTDAMRTLLESTNPNTHMNEPAVKEAADQVKAQFRLQPLRAQYLEKSVGDPLAYAHAVNTFNQYADPRVLQYPDMSEADKNKMVASMSPRERAAFGSKIWFFQNQGWLK